MADKWHATIGNADLHEPKGTDVAEEGQVYVFRAPLVAEWEDVHYVNVSGNGVLPAHKTLTAPTAYATLGMTDMVASKTNGQLVGGQGPSITWNDAPSLLASLSYTICIEHTDAATQPVFVTIMKNGVALTDYELNEEIDQNDHHSFSDTILLQLAFGDSISLCAKVAAGNLIIHNAHMCAWGIKE